MHFEEKRFADCDAACREAIARGREARAPYATIAKAFARLGSSALARGELAAAVEHFESAQLEQRTDEVGEKLKKAKKDLKAQLEAAYLSPEKAAEAKEAGNAAFKAGDFKGAIAHYSEAVKREPTNAAYYQNRATAKAKLMEFPSALEDCEAALKLDPGYVKALNRKGNCQFAMKDYGKALDTFRAAQALEPANADTRDGIARTVGKINEASSGAGGPADEDRARRAMADPEIQAILRDPIVSQVGDGGQSRWERARVRERGPIL